MPHHTLSLHRKKTFEAHIDIETNALDLKNRMSNHIMVIKLASNMHLFSLFT